MRTAAGDLTAPARIRLAAIDQFGRHGFDIGVRAIAEAAGVSLGLIRHHFGSKDGLRAACDEQILHEIRELEHEYVESDDFAGAALDNILRADEFQPMARYILQTLRAGGDLARDFVERTIIDAENYLRIGEEKGEIKPTENPTARARHVVMTKYGALMLQHVLYGDDLDGAWNAFVDNQTLAGLEVYTHGLFTDSTILDQYRAFRDAPPGSAPDAS